MPEALVIAVGNPLRADDGVGHAVADALLETPLPPDVEVLKVHQLTPELAQPLSGVKTAVFIDAAAGPELGKETFRKISALPVPPGALSHQCSPEQLLFTARSLYGRAPEGFLFTVESDYFEVGEKLSGAVRERIPGIVRRLRELLAPA